MKTIEMVKSRIERLDRRVNSYKEIEAACPVMKRQIVNGKMAWILQNPETLKWAVISEAEMEELNNAFHIAKYGDSVNNDPFTFNA
jgi:hypothetical protein